MAPAAAITTVAVILVDFRNEFAKPGGRLHEAVSEVMQENGMLEKVVEVVELARKSGALVIHSPGAPHPSHLSPLDEADQWNPEIVDELQPKDIQSEIVLMGRANILAWEGSELRSILEENDGIKSVILLGFLSDEAIEETAIDLLDDLLDLNILVCLDGTASTKEKHSYTMNKTLPTIGINVVTCAEAQLVIKGSGHQPLVSSQSFVRPILQRTSTDNISTHDAMFMDKKFNVYEINNILRGSGVLIPSDVLVSVYAQSNSQAAQDHSNDRFYSIPLAEIHRAVHEIVGERQDIPIKTLKSVAMDLPSVFNFTAGLLLFIGLFPVPNVVKNIGGGLMVNVFYIIASGTSVIGMPLNEWKNMNHVERNAQSFKQSLRREAHAYDCEKRASMNSKLLGSDYGRLPKVYVQTMTYIEEVIFSETSSSLTKAEVEMLLLRHLGLDYSSRTLDHILFLVCQTNSQKISPIEFHRFIASNDKNRKSFKHYMKRAWFILMDTMLSLGYLMALSFFIALSLTIIEWSLKQYEINPDLFAYTWLYVVGTMGFSQLSFEHIRNTYDMKDRARELLSSCIRYAQFYQPDSDVWKGLNTNKSIDVTTFRKNLEIWDILLSESEVDDLIRDINTNGDNIITKEELERYLEHEQSNRLVAITLACMRSKSFLSNTSWLVGAIGYAYAFYSSGRAYEVGNTIGAVGYFLGGAAYASRVYKENVIHLDCLMKLKYATKRLLRISSRRFAFGARKTLPMTMIRTASPRSSSILSTIEHDTQAPRPTWMDMNWMKRRSLLSLKTDSVASIMERGEEKNETDRLEDFLSRLVSYTSENELKALKDCGKVTMLSKLACSPNACSLTGSLFMYRLTMNHGGGEHAGFMVYPSCCDPFLVQSIYATISNNCTKLLITMPSHCPPERGIDATDNDPYQLSCNLIEDNFGRGCMIPTLIEADLCQSSLHAGQNTTVSAPTLIYSQDKTRSLLHFKLHETVL